MTAIDWGWSIEDTAAKLPEVSEKAIRPTGSGVAFVQLDDLKAQEQIDSVRPAAFIIHETSPGNRQAWIAVSGVSQGKEEFKEFMRRVRRSVGVNDKAASHATRLAGTENWKTKYLPDPPTVTIPEAHPGRIMTPAQLEELHLLAEPARTASVVDLRPHRVSRPSDRARQWPDYERCLLGAPRSGDGNGPDRSLADYFFCKMAAQRGWSVEQTEQKLLEVSEKARERARGGDEGYAHITAVNAAAAAEQARRRGRGQGPTLQSWNAVPDLRGTMISGRCPDRSGRKSLDHVARAAALADLRQIMLLGELFKMYLDGVAVGAGRILNFLDGGLASGFDQLQNLAGKGGQVRA